LPLQCLAEVAVSTAFGPPGAPDRAAPPAACRACRPLRAAGTQRQHRGGAEWQHWHLHACAHHHAPRATTAAATAAAATAAAATAAAATAAAAIAAVAACRRAGARAAAAATAPRQECRASGSGHPRVLLVLRRVLLARKLLGDTSAAAAQHARSPLPAADEADLPAGLQADLAYPLLALPPRRRLLELLLAIKARAAAERRRPRRPSYSSYSSSSSSSFSDSVSSYSASVFASG
jgi:hypothetical protein